MSIDPLAELIALLQPSARFSKLVEGAGTWQIHRHQVDSSFYCAVLEGQCCITINGQMPILLQAGDFVLVPALHDLINSSLALPIHPINTIPIKIGENHFHIGQQDQPIEFRMQVGFYCFNSPDSALLLSLLPQIIIVKNEPRLTTLVNMVAEESSMQRPARHIVLEHLLELLLIEALRNNSHRFKGTGLVNGMADERLSMILPMLHAHPEYSWTVAELAQHAAMSRSAFFTHFQQIMGMPPMEYLLAWRMTLAKNLLKTLSVQQVAEKIGYSSTSAFSTAFSRYVGISPARYARQTL